MVLDVTLRVQVPNIHILAQNLYYNYHYPNPKYLIVGHLDPLGKPGRGVDGLRASGSGSRDERLAFRIRLSNGSS